MLSSHKTKRSGCKQATYRQRYYDLITSLYRVGNAKGEFPRNWKSPNQLFTEGK